MEILTNTLTGETSVGWWRGVVEDRPRMEEDMNKHIPCKRCSGRGFINWTFSEGNTGTATSYICPDCNGSGDIVVPMTNADRIRAMSDAELAVLLLGGCRGSKCNEQEQNEYGSVNCYQCRLKWLQQPEEKEQL